MRKNYFLLTETFKTTLGSTSNRTFRVRGDRLLDPSGGAWRRGHVTPTGQSRCAAAGSKPFATFETYSDFK